MLLWIELPATFPENVWEYIDIDLLPPFKLDEARYQITLFWCTILRHNYEELQQICTSLFLPEEETTEAENDDGGKNLEGKHYS